MTINIVPIILSGLPILPFDFVYLSSVSLFCVVIAKYTMLEFLLMLASMVLHVLDQGIAMARLVVYHALVCVRNARKLWSMLVRGTQTWVIMLGRLVLFTILLAPGWYQLLKYFFFNPFILRNVEYGLGSKFRNVLDIYLPIPPSYNRSASKRVRHHTLAPVVIFVSGGAWMIGYKLWSALVGRGLAALGYLVIVPDYRNFPQGDIEDMLLDIRRAVHWTGLHCQRFGGDPAKITLAGQSAGAHICLCLLVKDYLREKQALLSAGEERGRGERGEEERGEEEESIGGFERYDVQPLRTFSRSSAGPPGLSPDPLPPANSQAPSLLPPSSLPSIHTPSPQSPHVLKEIERWVSPLSYPPPPLATPSDGPPSLHTPFSFSEPGRGGEDVWREVFTPLKRDERWRGEGALGALGGLGEREGGERRAREGADDTHSNNSSLSDPDSLTDTTLLPTYRPPPSSLPPHLPSLHPPACPPSPPLEDDSSLSVLPFLSLFIGVSGPYNLLSLSQHLHERGLDSSILSWICRGDLSLYSPSPLLAKLGERLHELKEREEEALSPSSFPPPLPPPPSLFSPPTSTLSSSLPSDPALPSPPPLSTALSDFPPVALFHGALDQSIPLSISRELWAVLTSHGAPGEYREYSRWSHTDAILEAPLGGDVRLFRDMDLVIRKYVEKSGGGGGGGGGGEKRGGDRERGERERKERERKELEEREEEESADYSPLLSWPWKKQSSAEERERGQQALAPRTLVKFARLINPF